MRVQLPGRSCDDLLTCNSYKSGSGEEGLFKRRLVLLPTERVPRCIGRQADVFRCQEAPAPVPCYYFFTTLSTRWYAVERLRRGGTKPCRPAGGSRNATYLACTSRVSPSQIRNDLRCPDGVRFGCSWCRATSAYSMWPRHICSAAAGDGAKQARCHLTASSRRLMLTGLWRQGRSTAAIAPRVGSQGFAAPLDQQCNGAKFGGSRGGACSLLP